MTSIYKEPLLDLHIAESEFLHGRYESPVDVGIRETLRFPWLTVLDFSAAAHVDYDVLAARSLAAADEKARCKYSEVP